MKKPKLHRILCIEDESDMREIIQMTLEEQGYEVFTAAGGREGIAVVEKNRPDLILLDVVMPEMEGPAVFKILRENEKSENIPVIFMTGRARSYEIEKFKKLGAIGVFVKPFDPVSFPQMVQKMWNEFHLPPSILKGKLKVQQERYVHTLPVKIEEIEKTGNELLEGEFSKSRLERLQQLVHRLAGSGGTFGFHAVSREAEDFEILLTSLAAREALPSPAEVLEMGLHLAKLREAFDEEISFFLPPPVTAEPKEEEKPHPVYLLADEQGMMKDLAKQLAYFGYEISLFNDLEALKKGTAETKPCALILSASVFPYLSHQTETLLKIKHSQAKPIPIFYIGAKGDDMMSRLAAVQSGGDAYFKKPVDINTLIDCLDALTAPKLADPYRILIVDDEEELAGSYAAILREAKMEAKVATDPLKVMKPLIEFKPDLILMDMYMPSCSGLDLAAVIRQQEAFVSIPIVFLSTEINIKRQMAALRLGSDDFLTKPIEPDHLIAAVASRVERLRTLRTFMVKDSLTGLLNHTHIEEQLAMEVARAKRQKGNFCFAILDIDHFKRINDSYGHLTGDYVIKSLARFLQQRLRKTDRIGRYGGEEFAVMLLDVDGPAAFRILNQIREDFSHVKQHADAQEFSVTFSAGISVFPSSDEVVQLTAAADKALYEAKRKGRNQIVLAS